MREQFVYRHCHINKVSKHGILKVFHFVIMNIVTRSTVSLLDSWFECEASLSHVYSSIYSG